jgi:hypothetical protein
MLEGISEVSLGGKVLSFREWKGEVLTCADVVSFLSHDGPIYGHLFGSQRQFMHKTQLGTAVMNRPRYPLNWIRLLANLGVPKHRRAELLKQNNVKK